MSPVSNAKLTPNLITLLARPSCPKCKAPMMLARVTIHAPGIDDVTYDCAVCDTSETILVNR